MLSDTVTVNFVVSKELPINVVVIAEESKKDSVISKVICLTKYGWKSRPPLIDSLSSYFNSKDNLSVDQNCLMFGTRVVIPSSLRKQVLDLLHEGHPGIVRMKYLARSVVWWPNLSKDVETRCSLCEPCATVNLKHDKVFVSWPDAKCPFQRVHLDYYQFQKSDFLILADSFPKWLHVQRVVDLTAETLITVLLSVFLFTYRNTRTTTTSKSPNEMLFLFKPRTPLTILNPKCSSSLSVPPFKDGDLVNIKLSKRLPVMKGHVVKYLGSTRYLVSIQGVLHTPHVNQMSHCPPV